MKHSSSANDTIFISATDYVEIEKVANEIKNLQKAKRKSSKKRPQTHMEEIVESPDQEKNEQRKNVYSSYTNGDLPQFQGS
jgi:predicted AAA+ superfamily ATPase